MPGDHQFWDIGSIDEVQQELAAAIEQIEEEEDRGMGSHETKHIKLTYMGLAMISQRQQKLERRVMAAITLFSVIITFVTGI